MCVCLRGIKDLLRYERGNTFMNTGYAESFENWGLIAHCFMLPDLVFTQGSKRAWPPSLLYYKRSPVGWREALPMSGQTAHGGANTHYIHVIFFEVTVQTDIVPPTWNTSTRKADARLLVSGQPKLLCGTLSFKVIIITQRPEGWHGWARQSEWTRSPTMM